LSSFYLDMLKDRMYTFAPASPARRSAQTVLWQITETLVRLVAPILSFTADEVWEYLPAVEGRDPSVHLALFPKPEEVFSQEPSALLEEWKKLFEIRDAALRLLEQERQAKRIGKGLEADVLIETSGEALSVLQRYLPSASDLKEFFNVSAVQVKEFNYENFDIRTRNSEQILPSLGGRVEMRAVPASGHKCARCWNFMPAVSPYGIWQNVCTRCHAALHEMGITPPQPTPAEESSK